MTKQEFTIPKNTDKISVEEVIGKIVIEFITKPNIFKNGDIEFYDKKFLEIGLIFKTKKEAEDKALEIINLLQDS